jgi:hypothetical protein
VFWSNGLIGAGLILPWWPMTGGTFDKHKGLVATKKPAA